MTISEASLRLASRQRGRFASSFRVMIATDSGRAESMGGYIGFVEFLSQGIKAL
jgi:hypothetical protein